MDIATFQANLQEPTVPEPPFVVVDPQYRLNLVSWRGVAFVAVRENLQNLSKPICRRFKKLKGNLQTFSLGCGFHKQQHFCRSLRGAAALRQGGAARAAVPLGRRRPDAGRALGRGGAPTTRQLRSTATWARMRCEIQREKWFFLQKYILKTSIFMIWKIVQWTMSNCCLVWCCNQSLASLAFSRVIFSRYFEIMERFENIRLRHFTVDQSTAPVGQPLTKFQGLDQACGSLALTLWKSWKFHEFRTCCIKGEERIVVESAWTVSENYVILCNFPYYLIFVLHFALTHIY